MTLKEFYAATGGDYEDVLARLMNEQLVKKFLFKFLDDGNYETLMTSLKTGDYPTAFRAAHTIKGVCQNLSFNVLLQSSSALTEALRNGRQEEYEELSEQVKKDYAKTVLYLKELRNSEA